MSKGQSDNQNSIINMMPSMFIILNENMQVIQLNQLAEKECGLTLSEVKGKNIFDLIPFLASYKADISLAYQKEQRRQLDNITVADGNGDTRYLKAYLYPLKNEGDSSLAIRIDDVTEHTKGDLRLIQSDKLAMIGLLTAGIAHEINNPINFVYSAIMPLKKNIDEIVYLLEKYSEIKIGTEIEKQIEEIEKIKKNMDLDYTIKETNELIQGIKDGASRTAIIVKDLKSYARVDENSMKKTNLQECIDSTLTLLRHNYKDRINIIKAYGDIPDVDCFQGKMNQVIMNLLSNAIDSIAGNGDIHIKTEKIGENVKIRIKDSGSGIDQKIINRIFEPFYTTKAMGKGTGLGLSITSSIIHDHNGTIEVVSELGKGTEFIITLPIDCEKISR